MPETPPLNDTVLGCRVCYTTQEARYVDLLADGWPSHCGTPMAVAASSVPPVQEALDRSRDRMSATRHSLTVGRLLEDNYTEQLKEGLRQAAATLRQLYDAITPALDGDLDKAQASALFDARQRTREILGFEDAPRPTQ